jgi:hypothetical protein
MGVAPRSIKEAPPGSSTRLGDWYANAITLDQQQLVLAVSGVTLLPVLITAAPYKTVGTRLPLAIGEVLRALGVAEVAVAAEVVAMSEVVIGPTNNQSVLGSMNDFTRMLDAYLDGRALRDVSVHLADTPCGPLGMGRPEEVTRELLGRPELRVIRGGA